MTRNARRDDWIMVRLRRETHAALIALALKWQKIAQEGGNTPYAPDGELLSLNNVVAELLRRDDEHRARSRKSVVGTRGPDSPAKPEGSP